MGPIVTSENSGIPCCENTAFMAVITADEVMLVSLSIGRSNPPDRNLKAVQEKVGKRLLGACRSVPGAAVRGDLG